MVTYFKVSDMADEVIYAYYPEGREDCERGLIRLNTVTGNAILEKLAEKDTEYIISAEELNVLRDSAEEIAREIGEPIPDEEEWPRATKDEIHYTYASHVIYQIERAWEKGEIQDKGTAVWH